MRAAQEILGKLLRRELRALCLKSVRPLSTAAAQTSVAEVGWQAPANLRLYGAQRAWLAGSEPGRRRHCMG